MELTTYFWSVLQQDRAAVVICNLQHEIIYMNPAAVQRYAKSGGAQLILLSSFTCVGEGEIPLTFILVAVIYIGQQVYQGLFVQDNISNLTHILGGLVGAGLGFIMNRNKISRY